MPIKSEYEKRIEAYLESNSCGLDQFQRIEITGKVEVLPIYRLPIKLLVFNVKNGRFAADLENLEGSLRRKLDAWKKDDSNRIKKILLEKSPHDTAVFREDLKRRGQMQPGVVTAAGVVINANRRMAILKELYNKTSHDKFAYLETSILPRGTSETEIYKIEARLQYAKDFKQPFGAVNELIKIEEGLQYMSKRELSKLLVRSEKYIDEHIAQLSLLRAYSKYAWKSVDYKKAEEAQITEIITDIDKNLKQFKNQGRSATDIKKLLEVQFAYIKSGCTYRDIRDIGKYSQSKNIEKSYIDALSRLKSKKVTEESFKEIIYDINLGGKRVADEDKPVLLASHILDRSKKFQDKQFKLTLEVKDILKEVSQVITSVLKKK